MIFWHVLANDEAWDKLHSAIDPQKQIAAAESLLRDLRTLGAKTVVIETEYLDRDFTAEFAKFYATVFKRYSKICRRYHFFSEEIGSILQETNPQTLAESLEKIGQRCYVGFIVVRPLAHAPLGRAVIATPNRDADKRAKLLVRAKYPVHLLGAELTIEGFPFTQQDARISSCAQATIWMAGRHFFSRHRGAWFTTVDISDAASQPTDTTLVQSLPAGSGGLGINNMVRALRAMGREPFSYIAPHIDSSVSPMKIDWGKTLRPHEIINRYVDSGIPVILGLGPWEVDQTVGHAVVVVGHTVRQLDPAQALPSRPTRAEYCEYFLVNDDQRGAELRTAISKAGSVGDTPYNVEQNVAYIIVPLPKKVFINAESAEKIAWDLLSSHFPNVWNTLAAKHADDIAPSKVAGDAFADAIAKNRLVARTYLTFGWKYKARLLRNIVSDTVKMAILRQDFPRFVWVTEFGDRDALNSLDPENRRILSHAVIDATSSNFWHGVSVFHAPGFVTRWFHDPKAITGDPNYEITIVPDERPYSPKIRGRL